MASPAAASDAVQVSFGRSSNHFAQLAHSLLRERSEIVVSGLGSAVQNAVTVAEILKKNGFAVVKSIETDLIDDQKLDDAGRPQLPKSKIAVSLERTPSFDKAVKEGKETSLTLDDPAEDAE